MQIPKLDPVNRSREYNRYTEQQRDKIVYYYLFVKGTTNRNIDEGILGLDPIESKGYQSMGILHHLGLKSPHKGIFIDYSIEDGINLLIQQDAAHYKNIIDSLMRFKSTSNISRVFDSWELIENNIALKTVDRSVFAHLGTGIPMGIKEFFEIRQLDKRDRKNIILIYQNNMYSATIEMDNLENPRSRMIWKADFRDLLQSEMPLYYDMFLNGDIDYSIKLPRIRFTRLDNGTKFEVDFIYIAEIEDDIKEEISEDSTSYTVTDAKARKEGKIKYVYGKQYERDSQNRIDAIKYHGTKCAVCEFDFEKVYGSRGKGYIEIHHVKPLSSVGKETDINPKSDLIPVCSNCHKMIHRKKDNVLSIEEMKQLIKRQ